MSPLHLFHWYDHTALAAAMRKSTWAFAVVEMVHLIGLALLGGVVLIVNLRLLGVILRGRPVDRIARELWPFLAASVAVLTVTGVLMVSEETMKCYYNTAFRLKMILFLPALILSIGIHRSLAGAGEQSDSGRARKLAACASLALWLGVGVAGRAIGYL
jgi:putative copper export protein